MGALVSRGCSEEVGEAHGVEAGITLGVWQAQCTDGPALAQPCDCAVQSTSSLRTLGFQFRCASYAVKEQNPKVSRELAESYIDRHNREQDDF